MFLFPSLENEFRGELLNQRWTCGEKISSCEGAASLHGTRIKVSGEPFLLHDHPLPRCGDSRTGPHGATALGDQLGQGDGAFPAPKPRAGTGRLCLLVKTEPPAWCVQAERLPAGKIWLRGQIFQSFPSSLVPSFKDSSGYLARSQAC